MGGGLRGTFSAGVRVLAFGALATAGSAGALLAANPAARAESSDLEEEASVTDRAIDRLGLGSWFTWAREPAERAGCPPGKLLPDPMDLPPGVIQRTLVLSLEDTLVHTEWDRKIGFRTRKRPGLDAFLAHMSQFYEIVIFTSALSSYGQPITDKLQEGGAYFQHALFNEHTKGNRIKDLSYLNRDLRHVIMVDTNPNSYRKQPLNGVAIRPWDGDLNDTELIDLVPFLEAIFKEDIQDVREVIRGMDGHNIPARMRELRRAHAAKRPPRGKKDAGVLASVAVRAPITERASTRAAPKTPSKPAPPAKNTASEDSTEAGPDPAAAAAAASDEKEESKRKKLFNHKL